MKKLIALAAAVVWAFSLCRADDSAKFDYMPKFGGVFVGKYEGHYIEDTGWEQRFDVRYARVHVKGKVLPQLDYFMQVDLCDQGKFKFLDAWARWSFSPQWKVQLGQFRVPFGMDAFRGPGTYIFANRAFIVKNMVNVRQVGFKVGYYGTSRLPLSLEAGVFNSKDKADHNQWQKAMDWAAKGVYRIDNVSLSASFVSLKPEEVRMNVVEFGVAYLSGRWVAEAEVLRQHYVKSAFRNVDGYSLFSSYSIPVKWNPFHELSFQGRFDGMGAHSNGSLNPEGELMVDDRARRRITLGSTISAIHKPVKASFKINVEKYLYNGEGFWRSPTVLLGEVALMF